jgi:hypothetical protein
LLPIQRSDDEGHNPVWKQLQQISYSPFSARIKRARLATKFSPPNLVSYDGKSDSMGHLSHYRQSMALYNGNYAFMCRIFPSSLGEVTLRWFDRLEHGSICSWRELSKAFTTCFITNTKKPKEVDSLMALIMKSGETLKSYSSKYWETYKEIDRYGEDLAIRQFRFGLPQGCRKRQYLTKNPLLSMADLMSRIEQHIRVEEDGVQPQRS